MKLNFRSGIVIDDNLIFSCKDFNGLFEINLNSNEVNYLADFEGSIFSEWKHCANPISAGNTVYFIPGNDNKIVEYNYSDNTIKEYSLPEKTYIGSEGYIEGNELYLFSDKYENGFWIFNILSKEIKPEKELFSSLNNLASDNGYLSVCLNEDVLVAADRNTGRFLSFNINTKEKLFYKIENLKGIHQVYYFRGFYYVTLKDSFDIIRFCDGEVVKRYKIVDQQWTKEGGVPYGKILSNKKNELLFINYNTKYLVLLDIERDSVEVIKDSYEVNCDAQNGSGVYYKEKYYVFPENTGIMLEIDNKSIIKHPVNIGVKEIGVKRMVDLDCRGKAIKINENIEEYTIRDFIEYLL